MIFQFEWHFKLSDIPIWVTFHFEWHSILSEIPFWVTGWCLNLNDENWGGIGLSISNLCARELVSERSADLKNMHIPKLQHNTCKILNLIQLIYSIFTLYSTQFSTRFSTCFSSQFSTRFSTWFSTRFSRQFSSLFSTQLLCSLFCSLLVCIVKAVETVELSNSRSNQNQN